MIYASPGNTKEITIFGEDPNTVIDGTLAGMVNLPVGIAKISVSPGSGSLPSVITASFAPILDPVDNHARATFSASTVTGTVTI